MHEVWGAYGASGVNEASGVCVECADRLKWIELVRYMDRLWWSVWGVGSAWGVRSAWSMWGVWSV